MKRYILRVIVFFSLVLRIYFIFSEGSFDHITPDEDRSFQIAENFLAGNGFTFEGEKTAFHSSFPLFIYIGIIKAGISKTVFVVLLYVLSVMLFGVSILFFYKLANDIIHNSFLKYWATIFYAFYPSCLYFIGAFPYYENIVSPLYLIMFFVFYKWNFERDPNAYHGSIMFVIVAIVVALTLRMQILFPIVGLLIYSFVFSLLYENYRLLKRVVISAIGGFSLFFILCVPVFQKNYGLFGAYILSTQSGYELMQGHNDIARGSWHGGWQNPDNIFYRYSYEKIPNIETLNEFEESVVRKKIALKWIIENPVKEIELIFRKSAILFLPRNFEGGFNIINAFIHVLFIASLFWFIFRWVKKRRINGRFLILYVPVLSVMMLCYVFFVGFRWRFYCEPFMILAGFVFLSELNDRFKVQFGKG